MHDQKFLNEYFSKDWCGSTSKYIYSGYAIVDKISNDEHVIDIGCGKHPFKGYIKNLTGIDPAFKEADIITTIEDFEPPQKYDIALCLGSINFGDEKIIANQIEKINGMLHPCAKIFWRLNPGQTDHYDYDNNHIDKCKKINFYPWTFEKLKIFAKKYNFEQLNCAIDTNGTHERLYAEWIRGY